MIRKYRRKVPRVRFSSREKLSLVLLFLLLLLGVLIGVYLFASYKGEIWDV